MPIDLTRPPWRDLWQHAKSWRTKYGIELFVRSGNGCLYMWPPGSAKQLPAAERDYFRVHRDYYKQLVRAGLHPQLDVPDPEVSGEDQSPDRCPYCGQRPCVGPQHHQFTALHRTDPSEIKRRNEEATREMLESLRRDYRGY